MACQPPPHRVLSLVGLDPCQRCAVLEDALFRLASGQQKVRIENGEHELEFHRGSVTALERLLARERVLCDQASGKGRRAITIGRTHTRRCW